MEFKDWIPALTVSGVTSAGFLGVTWLVKNLIFTRLQASVAADFNNSLLRYHNHAIDCFKLGVPASVGAQMVMVARSDPEAKTIQDESLRLRLILDQAVIKEAERYSHV